MIRPVMINHIFPLLSESSHMCNHETLKRLYDLPWIYHLPCGYCTMHYLQWMQSIHSAMIMFDQPSKKDELTHRIQPSTSIPSVLVDQEPINLQLTAPRSSTASTTSTSPDMDSDTDEPLDLVIEKSDHKISSTHAGSSFWTQKLRKQWSLKQKKVLENPLAPISKRANANARERSRVHTIRTAFEALRRLVPTYPNSPRLSKLSVLRIASCYIKSLIQCLEENPVPEGPIKEELSLISSQ